MKKRIVMLGIVIPLLGFAWREAALVYLPTHFPKPVYDFEKEPPTLEKVALGRALFYDPILSRDTMVSCASCHSPFNAFAHTDHALSHGIGDSIGNRNAPALFNLAWQKQFMWDGAIHHIEVQALAPIHNSKEMGDSLVHVVRKLQAHEKYPALFYTAFGDSAITGQHVLKALAQFQLTLVSAQAKYDQVMAGKDTFTLQEQNGYRLFQQNCNSCHREPLFSSYQFANNGLPIDTTLNDYGQAGITHLSQDSGLFKIPSLRNLSYSHPYMHDGRFRKLNQVLNHYINGITPSATLAPQLRDRIALSADEKVDLIAFLLTLNDKTFISNPNFQFPKEIIK